MIEKPKRSKQLSNQERKIPANIQELITRYDLDNTDIYKYLEYLEMKINNQETSKTGDTLPIGAIMEYPGSVIPENWLLCDGRAISRNDYSELYGKIGTIYGTGDGSTTFNLPDLRGKVPVGKDDNDEDFDTLGNTGGEKEHTLTISQMPKHNHGIKINVPVSAQQYSSGTARWPYQDDDNVHKWTENVGGGEPHNNLQPYIIQNYIIKAKQSAGIVATVVDGLNSTSATDALSAKQGKILNDKFSKHIITAYPTAENTNITSEDQVVTLNGSYSVGTNKLVLENNAIKVGANVSKVLISAQIFYQDHANASSLIPNIKINGNKVVRSIMSSSSLGNYVTVQISPFLIDVNPNDVITLTVGRRDGATSGSYRGIQTGSGMHTYLTVEVIE